MTTILLLLTAAAFAAGLLIGLLCRPRSSGIFGRPKPPNPYGDENYAWIPDDGEQFTMRDADGQPYSVSITHSNKS